MVDQLLAMLTAAVDDVRTVVVSPAVFLTFALLSVFGLAGMVLCAIHNAFLWLSDRIAWLRMPWWLLPEDLRPARQPVRWWS